MRINGKKAMAGWQIILMVSLMFAAAFVFSESVSGQVGDLTNAQKAAAFLEKGTSAGGASIFPPGTVGTSEGFVSGGGASIFGPTVGGAIPIPTGVPGPTTLAELGTSLFKGTLFGTQSTLASVSGALVTGAVWGGIVGGIVYGVALAVGLSDPEAESLGIGAGVGTFAGVASNYIGANVAGEFAAFLGAHSLAIGFGVGIVIILLTYSEEKQELVTFQCLPWEPPLGGDSCDLCNGQEFPCSEYRCKSLGQACEIVNPGTLEEMCVWISKDDTSGPKITPWVEALYPSGLSYIPDSTITPPNTGFKILGRPDGCLQPFTPLEFGFMTDEPAQCKIDLELKDTYDEMPPNYVGETNLFLTEHEQKLRVPSPFTEEGGDNLIPEIHNDGTYTLWIRCIDSNGNGQDSAMTAFRFCVLPGPDLEQPRIEGTSIENGQPVRFGVDSTPIEVYVNEPAECRWSKQDKSFEVMENEMDCATETYQINADLNYVCSGTLTGILDRTANDYYFRCQDYSNAPGGRNIMTTSHLLTLQGSEELVIDSIGPSGEIFGSASIVEVDLVVETAHGANDGASICYISDTPEDESTFHVVDEDYTFTHSQKLFLPSGDYTYTVRCVDPGNNVAVGETMFTVTVDIEGPSIARVFRDGTGLKVITSEAADCAYSLSTCNYNFEDGVSMPQENPAEQTVHFTEWDESKTYHIKCRDSQGNQPAPNECSIVAQGSEL